MDDRLSFEKIKLISITTSSCVDMNAPEINRKLNLKPTVFSFFTKISEIVIQCVPDFRTR